MSDSSNSEAINNALAQAHEQEPFNRSGPIYPHYQEILRKVVRHYPANTRLPSVRDIGKSLGISLVTAQRVVTELVNEGVLYSRQRAGLFTAGPVKHAQPLPTREAPAQPQASPAPSPFFENRLRFGTPSISTFQRPLWDGLIRLFARRYPNIQIELEGISPPTDPAPLLDAYEQLNWNAGIDENRDAALNLATYAPDEIAAQCTPEGRLPLYFRSNFLFFNRGLLERYDIAPPQYRTFAEQLDYFKTIAPALEKNGFNPKPAAVQQPITLLGVPHLEDFFNIVNAESTPPALLERLSHNVRQVIEFCRLNRRAPGFRNPQAVHEQRDFLEGSKAPFFLGHSVDYWEFSQRSTPFTIECQPTLGSDDHLFLWPMVGVVSRNSQHPAESIRFLGHLLSDEAQQAFASTGAFPANKQSPHLPATEAEPQWLQQRFASSHVMRLSCPLRCYLAINILNNELWHALLEHASVEQALAEAIQLGRSYLRQHAPQNAL